MKEKVFFTGGSGLLAINWALTVRNRYNVCIGLFDRDISLTGIEARYVSLDSTKDLTSSLKSINPKIVIHTAGLTNVEICEANPELASHINVELSANVARVCSNLRLPLIHISTDHLFTGSDSLLDEKTPTNPVNVYGRTKAEAETMVLKEYPEALVVRTNFFGWGPSYRKSFSDTIIETIRQEKTIKLFQDVFYTPIHVEILANAAHELINARASGIYNLVGDERLSKYEFGIKLARRFQLDTKYIIPGLLSELPELVKRPYDMSLSNKKTCSVLGRKLGGIEEQIDMLFKQEHFGLSKEIQNL